MRIKFPLGIDSFEKLRKSGCYYVDKTGFISTLLQDSVKEADRKELFDAMWNGDAERSEELISERDWVRNCVLGERVYGEKSGNIN